MRRVLLALTLALGGCAAGAPELPADWIAITEAASAPPELAPECTAKDKGWVDLPDGDISQADAARNYRVNKDRFGEMAVKRQICRTAVLASEGK